MQPEDTELRRILTRWIAEQGVAPSIGELARASTRDEAEVRAGLRRLQAVKGLLLHPNSDEVWVAHPFALSPGSCWVRTPARGYWANCLYCAFGIAAALRCDAEITTRLGGEAETIVVRVEDGQVKAEPGLIFHLSTPVRRWWDNVIHACATFQPFRSEADVLDWCRRHALPQGAQMSLPALWAFASEWYGFYVEPGWRRRTPEEIADVFARHGLAGPFWAVA